MKYFQLAKFTYKEDFGHDFYLQLFLTDHWALFQASVSWNDYPSWPYAQIKTGGGCILNFMFWVYRFSLDVGFIERTWNWDYMDNIEDINEVI